MVDKQMILPRVPSALITLAIDDLELVERDRRYSVNMNTWHRPGVTHKLSLSASGACQVCLAGAVMAKSFGVSVHEDVVPSQFTGNYDALMTLEQLRQGFVALAFVMLLNEERYSNKALKWLPECVKVRSYEVNPEAFKRRMRAMARWFKRHGY